MLYNIIVSDQAYEDITHQFEYILQTYNNKQAIISIQNDIDLTFAYLRQAPHIYSDCNMHNSRSAHLRKHRYKFIFEIDEYHYSILIKRFIHDLQDSY